MSESTFRCEIEISFKYLPNSLLGSNVILWSRELKGFSDWDICIYFVNQNVMFYFVLSLMTVWIQQIKLAYLM